MGEDEQWPTELDTLVNTIGPGSVPVDHVYDAGILPESVLASWQLYLSNMLINHGRR